MGNQREQRLTKQSSPSLRGTKQSFLALLDFAIRSLHFIRDDADSILFYFILQFFTNLFHKI